MMFVRHAIVLGLLATSPAGAQCSSPASAGLTVQGSATVQQAPDTAVFTVSVVTRGSTLDGTTQAHKARILQAKAALDRLQTEGATVEAASFDLTEERAAAPSGVRPAETPPTFRADTRYTIASKSLGKIDGLAAAVAATGLFAFEAARFSLEDAGAANDRARRAAMADARHQADVYADAAGLRLDGIERIADGDAAAADGAFDLPVRGARSATVGISPPKTLQVQGRVTVTWRVVPR